MRLEVLESHITMSLCFRFPAAAGRSGSCRKPIAGEEWWVGCRAVLIARFIRKVYGGVPPASSTSNLDELAKLAMMPGDSSADMDAFVKAMPVAGMS